MDKHFYKHRVRSELILYQVAGWQPYDIAIKKSHYLPTFLAITIVLAYNFVEDGVTKAIYVSMHCNVPSLAVAFPKNPRPTGLGV